MIKAAEMKKLLVITVIVFLFGSCTTQGRMIESSDSFKKTDIIRLVQYVTAKPDGINSGVFRTGPLPITVTFLSKERDSAMSIVSMEIKIKRPKGVNERNLVMYWVLDGEKIKVVADSSQPKGLQFLVPHSLWVSIANSNTIGYQIYLGEEGYVVELSKADENRLKYFFLRTLSMEEQKKPPIPEGRMKW